VNTTIRAIIMGCCSVEQATKIAQRIWLRASRVIRTANIKAEP